MKKLLHHVIAGLGLLLISEVSFAQTVLNSADNFVVFSATGAVANVGNSHLTGNVGAIDGSVTVGINVDGVMHVDDGAATTASQDLLAAYTYLSNLNPTFPPLSPTIGNSTTLPAGVYVINEAAGFVDGELTLDADNDPNARFIFHIMGTLNTSANTKVILTNGAVACNVFWVTEGAIDIGAGTIMKGNVIADNAAINIGPNVNLEGRALSTNGAISFTELTAYMPLGCGVPELTGPVAPTLESTVCYALFSSTGMVTNTGAGTTAITGDIGTNFGTTTGYTSANVNGTIHLVPDASTETAKDDLLNVNTYLNNLAPDINLLYPASFGNDLVLTPHTYLMDGTTTLTGTVTFNAQDNPNAIFVVKVDGPFSTIASAKVMLINNAQAKNVFWKVSGAVNISTLSDFKGTIVGNASIDFGEGSILEGRALTTNGAINTNTLQAAVTAGCAALPVSWLYFKGKPVQNNVVLEWATSNETNNNFFTIERSEDGVTFESLATVNAATITNTTNKYSFNTIQPSDLCYYRISQTDLNGEKDYFHTISVKTGLRGGFEVKHFISENNISVQVIGAQKGSGSLELYNINGQKISSKKIALTPETTLYTIAKPSQKGIYLVYITREGKKLYAGKISL